MKPWDVKLENVKREDVRGAGARSLLTSSRLHVSRATSSRRQTGRGGFTLIELIFVMVIIAFVAALIAPSLVSFGANQVHRNEANSILALTGYARAQSINEGSTFRLNFDAATRSVWLTVANGAIFDPVPGDYGQHLVLSNATTLTIEGVQHDDGQYVEFQSSGRVDPAKIHLINQTGGEIEIASDSPTDMYHIVPSAEVNR